MKCKLKTYIENKPDKAGLIEAYWNVNVRNAWSIGTSIVGLIEAYWNVNELVLILQGGEIGFNRSILKCKRRIVRSVCRKS